MRLRTRLVLLLLALHLLLAAAAVVLFLGRPAFLAASEIGLAISVALSARLVRALLAPVEIARAGAELLRERGFSSRFVPTGSPEVDALVELVNGMVDRLREERLAGEERRQLLDALVRESPAGIVLCGLEGEIESANPAAFRILGGGRLPEAVRNLAPGAVALEEPGDGRRFRVSCGEFRDRGFPRRFYLVEELTDELRRSEKAAYERLIRTMSHEVNNSAGAVRSLLESMRRWAEDVRASERDDYERAIEVASGRVTTLARFLEDFAEVVRLPSPRRRPERIDEVVAGVVELMRPGLEAAGVAIEISVAPHSAEIDRAQFEQVVLNALKNASEAAGRGGCIEVRLAEGELRIVDDGPGIPEELRSRLFTPFFSTKREGRGIGLTLVAEVLGAHGFRFSLRNRSDGKRGAEFSVTLG